MLRLAIALLLAVSVQGARLVPVVKEIITPGGKGTQQALLQVLQHHREEDEDDEPGYAAVTFYVPPSESDDFEEAWQKLANHVEKKEDVDIFTLKKESLNNAIYHSYGEWDSVRDLHEHFQSRHFEDFSKYVDDHDIRWELKLLDDLEDDDDDDGDDDDDRRKSHGQQPEQPEQDGKRRHRHRHHVLRKEMAEAKLAALPQQTKEAVMAAYKHSREDDDDAAHFLIKYNVPPGKGDEFEDVWEEAQRKTLKEKGNQVYSLRKVITDNTAYYAYGVWDSWRDYMDHFESDHVRRLREYTEDKDILWQIQPLEPVDDDDEDDDDDDRRKQVKAPAATAAA